MQKIRWLFVGYLIIAALTYYAYRNHFLNPFVFDDTHAVVENVHIRSLANIPKFFRDPRLSSTLPNNQGYRPIVTSSLALDYWFGQGLHPFYFHRSMFIVFLLQNLILCHLLFRLLRQSVPEKPGLAFGGALLATAIYSLHPANAETLNYVISRSDSYSTFFVVLGLWLSVVPAKLWLKALSIPMIALGVLTKEPASTFPALLFLALLFFRTGFAGERIFSRENRSAIWKAVVGSVPAAVTVLLSVVLYFSMVINALPGSISRLQYFITQLWVITHYFLMFLLPVQLNADSDLAVFENLFDERAIAGGFVICILLATAFLCVRSKRLQPISFGLLWFFITLSPTSSIFPIEDVTNDHRMFFPFIGLSIAAAWAIMLVVENVRRAPRILLALLGVLYFAGQVKAVEQRCRVWRSNESLWYDVTLKSPNNARGLMNYGLSQMARGNYARAEEYFLRSQKLWPNYSVLQVNFGVLYGAMNRKADAEKAFRRSLTLSGRTPTPYFYFGRWLSEERRFVEAKQQLEKAVEVSPGYLEAIHLLATVAIELQDRAALSSVTEKLTAIYPADPELIRYRKILSGEHPLKSTESLIEESLAAFNRGEFVLCIEIANKVLEQFPNNPIALNNVGAALNKLGKPESAIPILERALRMSPNFELAKNNLLEAKKLVAAAPPANPEGQ